MSVFDEMRGGLPSEDEERQAELDTRFDQQEEASAIEVRRQSELVPLLQQMQEVAPVYFKIRHKYENVGFPITAGENLGWTVKDKMLEFLCLVDGHDEGKIINEYYGQMKRKFSIWTSLTIDGSGNYVLSTLRRRNRNSPTNTQNKGAHHKSSVGLERASVLIAKGRGERIEAATSNIDRKLEVMKERITSSVGTKEGLDWLLDDS